MIGSKNSLETIQIKSTFITALFRSRHLKINQRLSFEKTGQKLSNFELIQNWIEKFLMELNKFEEHRRFRKLIEFFKINYPKVFFDFKKIS